MARYQGDDLINLLRISISAPAGEELPEIEAVELKIGSLCKKYEKPANPFVVNILREESVKLFTKNKCHACIWYWGEVDGVKTLLKKTCEGTFVLETNPEIINGRC